MFLGKGIDNNQISFQDGDKILKSSSDVKFLGIIIDDKLTFSKHITNLCITASNRLKGLYCIRKYVSVEQAKPIADTFILSNYRYCHQFWMFCSKTLNNKIDNIQYINVY